MDRSETTRTNDAPVIGVDLLLRERDVRRLTGLGRSTRWRMMAEGRFPQAVRIGKRWTAWKASDLRAWQDSLKSGAP